MCSHGPAGRLRGLLVTDSRQNLFPAQPDISRCLVGKLTEQAYRFSVFIAGDFGRMNTNDFWFDRLPDITNVAHD